MSRALTSFAFVAAMSALLMALSLAVARHGYPFGAIGVKRLDDIADAGTFVPLAAVYFFAALLMMILPIRAAGIVLNAADTIFWAVVVLFATIVGCLVARWAFGQNGAVWALWDWRFLFTAAVAGSHFLMNDLRRNILLRSLFFVVFCAATLACLFWSFVV